ncbi:hypothetical protein ABEB36_009031 [Hypothenemus hampei]|uniref:PHD-type domain-containing protein n=1 Tax=Hypothenemus hampei TaxID=57062 RepID=A0ABD1ENX8_HYPHA
MSGGGPPHHPHNRHVPPTANSAWNHLPVPGYFPRQPQLAHMQSDHSLLHQATWHTPTTTEGVKLIPHTQMLNEMFKNDAIFTRDCVDLSLTKNAKKTFLGSQNGEHPPSTPTTPISLSVRDTNKINSLPPGMLDIQAVELTKCPSLKPPVSPGSIRNTGSPGLKTNPATVLPAAGKSLSPSRKSASPGPILATATCVTELNKNPKRSNVRVDSILERLNPVTEKTFPYHDIKQDTPITVPAATVSKDIQNVADKPQSVIVQGTSNFDENSNSSGTTNAPTPKEEDSASMHSNEDSLDSTKSRRKRKPSKTVRLNKEDEMKGEKDDCTEEMSSECQLNHKDPAVKTEEGEDRKRLEEPMDVEEIVPAKSQRNTSSESETIDNIAALVQESIKAKTDETGKMGIIDNESVKTEENAELDVSTVKEKLEVNAESGIASALTKEDVSLKDEKDNISESESLDVVDGKKIALPEKSMSPPFTTLSKSPNTVSVIKTKPEEGFLEKLIDDAPDTGSFMTVPTQAQKKASATQFVEVENKLEEMFAGIVEEQPETSSSDIQSKTVKNDLNMTLTDDLSSPQGIQFAEMKKVVEVEHKKPIGKKARRSRASSKSDQDMESSPKIKKLTKTKSTSRKGTQNSKSSKKVALTKTVTKSSINEVNKDVYAYDSCSNASSSRSRGPFVQIRGPRDSPLSVNVINTPLTEEDGERKSLKNKKFHDDSEYRHKVRSKGLHSSTLSTKYDAEKKDTTWICAFCKRGPHASELTGPSVVSDVPPPGDLFGPYFVTSHCLEFEKLIQDPFDRQFKSRKITKVLDAMAAATPSTSKGSSKKSKKKSESVSLLTSLDANDMYWGITLTDNNTYEIWMHEDCLVWSPGVYLVGAKIMGLEEAVWSSCNVPCIGCGLKGANVYCVKRGCVKVSHVCCARKYKWVLDEEEFKSYCPEHRV